MRATDGILLSNLSSSNDEVPFKLRGGRYDFAYVSSDWNSGTATLKKLGPAGAYMAYATAFSADGHTVLELGPGTYYVTVATSTAVYIGIDRIPGE